MSETVSPFRQRVYEALRRVPRGRVTTYKLLGEAIGCASSQAIGQALRHNPYAPEVPCHRVIRTDLTLGGFSGKTEGKAIRRKLDLLREEGVEFVSGRLKDPSKIYPFSIHKFSLENPD